MSLRILRHSPRLFAFLFSVWVSLSCLLGVTTAAPRCVRKLECHVLTGVRGMLTGQTEGTDGSVTCPRSSGMPLSGALDLKPNTFFPFFFSFPPSFCRISLLLLPPSSYLSFFLTPLSLTALSQTSFFASYSPLFPLLGQSLTLSSFYQPFPPQCRSQSLLHRLLPISA